MVVLNSGRKCYVLYSIQIINFWILKGGERMAFKSKVERYAFVRGLSAGSKGKKPFRSKRKSKQKSTVIKAKPKKDKPVYDYSTYFDFNDKGNIRGGYTADGFFEPD